MFPTAFVVYSGIFRDIGLIWYISLRIFALHGASKFSRHITWFVLVICIDYWNRDVCILEAGLVRSRVSSEAAIVPCLNPVSWYISVMRAFLMLGKEGKNKKNRNGNLNFTQVEHDFCSTFLWDLISRECPAYVLCYADKKSSLQFQNSLSADCRALF